MSKFNERPPSPVYNVVLLLVVHCPVPALRKPDDRQFKVGDKVRVNLKIEDAIVKTVIKHSNDAKLQVDVVGLDLTALIDTRQVVE